MTPRVRSAVLWGGLATATPVLAAPPASADGSDIVLVSVTSQHAQVADAPAVTPSVSADGRWVVYESAAANLVGGDVNGVADIFVHELTTGVVRRVSVGADGAQAVLGDSSDASISADGRFVAFASAAPNLVAGDLNGSEDVFIHDTAEQVTRLVSVDARGRSTTGSSTSPRISVGDHVTGVPRPRRSRRRRPVSPSPSATGRSSRPGRPCPPPPSAESRASRSPRRLSRGETR